jgi:hypothetical protein
MSKQTISIGSIANDGTGSNLRAGGTIINDNFNELYTALGNGTTLSFSQPVIKFADDTSSLSTINLGQTLKILGGTGLSSSISGNTITLNIDSTVVTETGTQSLQNKTINASFNALSNISNSSLSNSTIKFTDDASTTVSIPLGQTIKLSGGSGVDTSISGNTVTIALESTVVTETSNDVLTNKSISGSTNTLSNISNSSLINSSTKFTDDTSTQANISLGQTLRIIGGTGIDTAISGNTLTITAASVPNSSLTNSSVSIGGNTITLGAAATTSISNLSLTGTGVIDITSGQNKIRHNFENTVVNLQNNAIWSATTYQGALAAPTGTTRIFFADSASWNEIATENSSINLFTDVDISSTPPTMKQVLVFNASSGKFTPKTIGAKQKETGDGSTTNFLILDNYTAEQILVSVNGLIQYPIDDYSVVSNIGGTDLVFVTAPVSSAKIAIRYLG